MNLKHTDVDKIDGILHAYLILMLTKTVVGMLLYVDDVVLLSRSSASLQRLLNKLC